MVFCGTNGFFSAGGDLRAFANVTTSREAREIAKLGRGFIDAFRSLGIPLVAAINGHAFGGGCELATACDVRIMEQGAKLHWVQGRMAVTTGWGGTARLVAIVGPGTAARWLLATATVDSASADAAGFVDAVVAAGESVDAACTWLDSVALVPAAASRAQLALIREARDRSEAVALASETRAFVRLWNSEAHHQAVTRFLDRGGAASTRAEKTVSESPRAKARGKKATPEVERVAPRHSAPRAASVLCRLGAWGFRLRACRVLHLDYSSVVTSARTPEAFNLHLRLEMLVTNASGVSITQCRLWRMRQIPRVRATVRVSAEHVQTW